MSRTEDGGLVVGGRRFVVILLIVLTVSTAFAHPHILKIQDRTEADFSSLIEDLADSRFVFLGETHDNPGHHEFQLAVMRALQERGARITIGLEMIRAVDQPALDAWVVGALSEDELVKVFSRYWGRWKIYRDIFLFAREWRFRMLGLNISPEIIVQVGKNGASSLNQQQVEALRGITCNVSPAYERLMRRAMGEHAAKGKTFRYFCEAQLIWDKVMARELVESVGEDSEAIHVVIAGSAHAWKHGIPDQIPDEVRGEYRVVLPEGSIELSRTTILPEDADYLWLDFGEDGWRGN